MKELRTMYKGPSDVTKRTTPASYEDLLDERPSTGSLILVIDENNQQLR